MQCNINGLSSVLNVSPLIFLGHSQPTTLFRMRRIILPQKYPEKENSSEFAQKFKVLASVFVYFFIICLLANYSDVLESNNQVHLSNITLPFLTTKNKVSHLNHHRSNHHYTYYLIFVQTSLNPALLNLTNRLIQPL